jgi:putative tributyrin esterase
MAYLKMTLRSKALGREDDVGVILPDHVQRQTLLHAPSDPGVRYQALWLVHGGHGSYSEYLRTTRIETYAQNKNLIVVLPTVRQTNGRVPAGRGDYFAYIAYELRDILAGILPLSANSRDNFIAGQSFGGYFCYHLCLTHPDRFACVGSFFSPLDCIIDDDRKIGTITDPSLVGDPEARRNTHFYFPWFIQENWRNGIKMPRMIQFCGTEDFTYTSNLSFLKAVRQTGYDHTWIQDSGFHSLDFVEAHLRTLLDWLPVSSPVSPEEGK